MSDIIRPKSVLDRNATEPQDEVWALSDKLEAKASSLSPKTLSLNPKPRPRKRQDDNRILVRESNALFSGAKAVHRREFDEIRDQAAQVAGPVPVRIQSIADLG
ncbi:MAG: hypothetical protein LQ346_002081 [Caloplaca aetnensis]|nr:MAG: hypothetical protein LQ346_002081 [Caloplaca aetnensis]